MLRSPLFHFLLVGALLFLIEAAWSRSPERPVVAVKRSAIDERLAAYQLQTGRTPSPDEERAIADRVIEEAIWLDQAYALGIHERDSIVRQRLLQNMRFLDQRDAAEGDASDATLLARAIELGMDRSDVVVQRRLIEHVKTIVRAGVRAEALSDADLEAYYTEHAERWREPALLDLQHVYFSRDRRAAAAESDAQALLVALRSESTSPETAIPAGDAFLGGHSLRGASPARIASRLGPSFAVDVEQAPTQEWIGPIRSAFGTHLVWIEARQPSRIPEFVEIRNRVFEDWVEERTRIALQDHLETRRALVEIRVIEDTENAGGVDERSG